MTPAEPADGAIVGWGNPIRQVRVRIDEWAEGDLRWFDADDQSLSGPWSWEFVIQVARGAHRPLVLLEPTKELT